MTLSRRFTSSAGNVSYQFLLGPDTFTDIFLNNSHRGGVVWGEEVAIKQCPVGAVNRHVLVSYPL